LSLVVWTWILGPLGALLAIPLTLLTKGLLVDIDPSTRWLSFLIASGPVTTPAGAPRRLDDVEGSGGPPLPPPLAKPRPTASADK
ncbi:MAG: hypothetical protein ACM3ZF_04960, partial [Mycobacterium leprae]